MSGPRRARLIWSYAFLRGAAAEVGVGLRTEALGQLAADVDLHRRVARLKLLDIGVDGDELDLRDVGDRSSG